MVMGADPVTNAAGYYGASQAFGGGGNSNAGRGQRELEDRRRQINSYQGLDPYLLSIINGQAGLPQNATPEDLVQRYSSVYNAENAGNQQSKDAAGYTKQIFGDLDQLNNYAYETFRNTFGRDPSSTEFAQILPVFGGTEGRQRGAAAVASMYDQYKQSPEYLGQQAPQYGGQIDSLFQETFGRAPTEAERQHFGTQLAGGRDSYDLGNELKGSQEYQTGQDKTFRSGLASELEGYDTSFFDKAKQNVIGTYARNWGGSGTSSSLDYALTNLMGEIAEKRGSYLANLSSSQYGGNKDAARDDYKTGMNRYFEDQDYNRNRQAQEQDYYRSRGDQDRDYMRERDDYYAMQSRQNQGRGTLHTGDWLNLGLQGAGAYAQSQSGRGTTNNYNDPYGYLNY